MQLRLIILISLVAWLSAESRAENVEISERTVFSLHSSLQLLTPTPHPVSRVIAELCTMSPPAQLLAGEQARTGPHVNALVNLYASSSAVGALASSTRQFPEGTIILKEKLGADGSVAAVGGMVKRPVGLDQEHGDWEYFYADKSGGFAKGLLQNCVQCHAKTKSTDYVYTIEKSTGVGPK